MSEPEIRREISGDRGRYVLATPAGEAELTFTMPAPGLISANHTGVPPADRGTGHAKALVRRMVADARAEGFRIIPRCPFVDAMRRRHPEWAEHFAT